ncbi:MAG: hypothetical protein AAF415_14350 [Pseudomonadota bacterium]
MSVVQFDSYRAKKQAMHDMATADAAACGYQPQSDLDPNGTFATEREADLALQLADANARIDDLEAVLVETLKRNAMNWARAQEAETKLSALIDPDHPRSLHQT